MLFERYVPRSIRHAYRWDARAGWLTGLYLGITNQFIGYIAREELHATGFQLALLYSAPFLGQLLSMLTAWHMQDRPKKPYVYWIGILSRGTLIFMALATTAWSFVGIAIATQMVSCFLTPAYSAIMRDAYPNRFRGQLMGMVRIGQTLGMMVTGIIAGYLMERGLPLHGHALWIGLAVAMAAGLLIAWEFPRPLTRVVIVAGTVGITALGATLLSGRPGYQLMFPLAGLVGALAIWFFNHLPEPKPASNDGARFNLWEGITTMVTDYRFGLYLVGFFICGFGNLFQLPLIPMFQVELGITHGQVGLLVAVGAGTSALFYVIWGRMMDRFNPFIAVVLAFTATGLAPLIFANSHGMPGLMLGSILLGLGNPGIDLAWLNAVMDFTGRDGIPRYSAVHMFMVGIRGLIAPFISTWLLHTLTLRQNFYTAAGIINAGCLFLAAVVWLVILPARKHPKPPASLPASARR